MQLNVEATPISVSYFVKCNQVELARVAPRLVLDPDLGRQTPKRLLTRVQLWLFVNLGDN